MGVPGNKHAPSPRTHDSRSGSENEPGGAGRVAAHARVARPAHRAPSPGTRDPRVPRAHHLHLAAAVGAMQAADTRALLKRYFQERSTVPAAAPVSAPRSQVTAPFTIVYSMPRERITMRFAPPGRS